MQTINASFKNLEHLSNTSHLSLKERKYYLQKLLKTIQKERLQIGKAVFTDFRKNPTEVELTEVIPVISEIKQALRNLKKWAKPQKLKKTLLHFTSKAYKIPQPKGLVLIISPWNYPFNLIIAPLISAIAAGNRVILKPSEFTPETTAIINKIINDVFTEDQVVVIEGDAKVSQFLTTLPFNHIFFTGSSAIGKKIMESAAKNLCSVTLELGGKSPCLITNKADIKVAARRVVWGKFVNAGQTCIAPDYVIIHHSVKEKFIEECIENIKQFYPYDAVSEWINSEYCGIIHTKHTNRLVDLIKDATEKSAIVHFGNVIDEENNFIMPTILSNVTFEMEVMKEEIFGPILPIITYELFEDAIKIIKNIPRPLAAYIFSKNRAQINTFRKEIITGGIVSNDVLSHYVHKHLPFGGVNNSGIGRAHGYEGFLEFSNIVSFLKTGPGPFSAAELLAPPYTKRKKKLIDLLSKYI